MGDTSRRTFLAVAGAGATAGTVGLVAGPAAAETRRTADSATGGVVAHIADHRSSRISLMVGDREVVVHDPDLVARILNAAGGK